MKTIAVTFMIGSVWLLVLSCGGLPSGLLSQETFAPPTLDVEPLPAGNLPDSFRGVPIMPGAIPETAVTAGGSYSYQIWATALDVQEYYLRQLPLAGWTIEDQTGDAKIAETSILFHCRKDGETVAVFISPAGKGLVQVLIF
jgi:hypothetical protein